MPDTSIAMPNTSIIYTEATSSMAVPLDLTFVFITIDPIYIYTGGTQTEDKNVPVWHAGISKHILNKVEEDVNYSELINSLNPDAPRASKNSIRALKALLSRGMHPDAINASYEDKSIILEYSDIEYYYLIESFNKGNTVFFKRSLKDKYRYVWDCNEENIETFVSDRFLKES